MRKKPRAISNGFVGDPDAPRDEQLKVLSAIRQIPRGFVSTYGRVADAAGFPKRARWVGQILRNSPLADGVPWHRVVNAAGRISLRGGDGPRHQCRLLKAEGVEINEKGRINLTRHLWKFRKKRLTKSRFAE